LAKRKMMAAMFAEMSSSDQGVFSGEAVQDGSGKTYGERYRYLTNYWMTLENSRALANSNSINEKDGLISLLALLGIALASSAFLFVRNCQRRRV
jgi:hypothetical protein